jgi:hypothetical protein
MSVESGLQALGFEVDDRKVLHAPSCRVRLVPLGNAKEEDRFFQLRVELKHAAVICVVASSAIKVEAVKP